MREENGKHNHRPTEKLKVAIFSIMMLLPFLAILTTTAYVALNENAKDSYVGSYKFKKFTNISEILNYDNYTITTPNTKTKYLELQNNFTSYYYEGKMTNQSAYRGIILPIIQGTLKIDNTSYNEAKYIYFYFNSIDNNRIELFNYDIPETTRTTGTTNLCPLVDENNNNVIPSLTINSLIANKTIEFELGNQTNKIITTSYFGNNNLTREWYNATLSNLTTTLWYYDNVISSAFYASTERVWHAPIFSWVMTGPFYTGITGFTSIFGIPNMSFLTNLLCYWITMTCIYVVFDIVIESFIYLTHIFTKGKRLDK